jgi:hypothetical protein
MDRCCFIALGALCALTLGGCGLAETAATGATAATSAAEQARQAKNTEQQVQDRLEAAQQAAADQRRSAESQTQ